MNILILWIFSFGFFSANPSHFPDFFQSHLCFFTCKFLSLPAKGNNVHWHVAAIFLNPPTVPDFFQSNLFTCKVAMYICKGTIKPNSFFFRTKDWQHCPVKPDFCLGLHMLINNIQNCNTITSVLTLTTHTA